MTKRLPQDSHKPSHTARSDAAHLTRKDGTYYYRRRLPDHLGSELALSLGTRNYREAEHLAEHLNSVYRRAVATVIDTSELRAILRRYLEWRRLAPAGPVALFGHS